MTAAMAATELNVRIEVMVHLNLGTRFLDLEIMILLITKAGWPADDPNKCPNQDWRALFS